MTALVGWCAECGQLVGRDCCWEPDRSCARCALARAASGNAEGGFAVLGAARAAVRQLDGTLAQFGSVESEIAAADPVRSNALVAWKDAWLAAGVLRARIDGSKDAARSWLRVLPASEDERASELHEELLSVEASVEERWQALESTLSVVGERLARRPGIRRRAMAAVTRPAQSAPSAAVAVAVPIPISQLDRAVIRVQPSAPTPAPAPSQPVAVSIASTAPHGRPTQVAAVSTPIHPLPPAQGVGPPPVTPAAPRPQVTANPARVHERAARPGWTASLLIAVVALAVAAGILAVTRLLPATVADGTPDRAGAIDPGATAGAAIASSTPVRADGPTSPPTVVAVDEHPIGPIDPGRLPITRVIGAPEVEAFPSPFDRSVRLGGIAGLCVASASPAGFASLAFELHLGDLGTRAGRLVVALPGEGPVLALDLASLSGLDRSAWYRVTVTGDDGTGRAVVTSLDEERSLTEIELEGVTSAALSTVGEACLRAELEVADASVFVDNVRVDT